MRQGNQVLRVLEEQKVQRVAKVPKEHQELQGHLDQRAVVGHLDLEAKEVRVEMKVHLVRWVHLGIQVQREHQVLVGRLVVQVLEEE